MNFKFILSLFALSLAFANWAVYESRNSDDVDFFLVHNPEENGALMFYNQAQEQRDDNIRKAVDKIIGIFKNINEEGRSNEEWVNQLNDKVHLMRIDATNMDNARSVQDYKVGKTPLLVLLDYGNVILVEAITDKSFDHVKDILVTKSEEKKKAEQQKKAAVEGAGTDGSKDQGGELAQAQKAAEDALKALEDVRKAFEEHLQGEKAKDDAEAAKKKSEQAEKELSDSTKKRDQGTSDDKKSVSDDKSGDSNKCTSDNSKDQKSQQAPNEQSNQKCPSQTIQQNNQQSTPQSSKQDNQCAAPNANNSAAVGQSQAQIEYIPVYRRLNQPQVIYSQQSSQPIQRATTTQGTSAQSRIVYANDHWHIVDPAR